MSKSAPPLYENRYCRLERILEKGKVRYKVIRKNDNLEAHTYDKLENARKYAKHLETWANLYTSRED